MCSICHQVEDEKKHYEWLEKLLKDDSADIVLPESGAKERFENIFTEAKKEAGGVIKLVFSPHGKPEEVFQITSLDRVFEIFHKDDEALASFS